MVVLCALLEPLWSLFLCIRAAQTVTVGLSFVLMPFEDSDYPVAKLESLQRFLWLNQGANFINVGSAYKDWINPHVPEMVKKD